MKSFTSILSRSLLALALAAGSAAAVAGPTYHVDVDTSTQAGNNGGLFLSFLSYQAGGVGTATVNHWTGNFAGTGMSINGATVDYTSRVLNIGSDFDGYLFDVGFGGHFGFDVTFDIDVDMFGGSFGVALTDSNQDFITGANVADINFEADQPVQVSTNAAYATVEAAAADVPEPASLALMLGGAGLLGFMRRRRA